MGIDKTLYNYYVTSEYGIHISDIEYDLDRNTWRDKDVSNKIIPHRIVDKVNPINTSKRNTIYALTIEEAQKLRQDPRIKGVTKVMSESESELYTTSEVQFEADFGGAKFRDEESKMGEGMWIHSNKSTSPYIPDKNYFKNIYGPNPTSFISTYNYSLTGKNVDLVIMDNSFNHFHMDFFSPEGNGRVKLYNWANADLGGSSVRQINPNTANGSVEPRTLGSQHGTGAASAAAGTIYGVAKKSNIFFMKTGVSNSGFGTTVDGSNFSGPVQKTDTFNLSRFDAVRHFHESKSINPRTKRKNPTVINQSQTSRTNLGGWHVTGSAVTGSFIFPDCGDLDGIRINYINKDYCIISASEGTEDILDSNINGIFEVGNYYFYSSSDFSGLRDKINNTPDLSSLFSCSIDSNNINLSSSGNIDWYVKVYTGSIFQFSGSGEDIQSPFGGNFAVELSGSAPPHFNITQWYPGGVASPLIKGSPPRLEYGFTSMKDFDHFGIDNGWNIPVTPSRTILGQDTEQADTAFQNYDPVTDAEIEELTDEGIIYVSSAGNRGMPLSRSGSSSDPYFREKYYNEYLWNSYFISPKENYSYADANTPTYYMRAYPSSPAGIQVGACFLQNRRSSDAGLGIAAVFGDESVFKTGTSNIGSSIDIFAVSGDNAASVPNNQYHSSNFFSDVVNSNFTSSFSASLVEFVSASLSSSFTDNFDVNALFVSSAREYGGTSGAAPKVAGAVCLYLEKYPDADVNEIKDWLETNSREIFFEEANRSISDFRHGKSGVIKTHSNGLKYFEHDNSLVNLHGARNELLYIPFGERELTGGLKGNPNKPVPSGKLPLRMKNVKFRAKS